MWWSGTWLWEKRLWPACRHGCSTSRWNLALSPSDSHRHTFADQTDWEPGSSRTWVWVGQRMKGVTVWTRQSSASHFFFWCFQQQQQQEEGGVIWFKGGMIWLSELKPATDWLMAFNWSMITWKMLKLLASCERNGSEKPNYWLIFSAAFPLIRGLRSQYELCLGSFPRLTRGSAFTWTWILSVFCVTRALLRIFSMQGLLFLDVTTL